jgi:hypothetical protein
VLKLKFLNVLNAGNQILGFVYLELLYLPGVLVYTKEAPVRFLLLVDFWRLSHLVFVIHSQISSSFLYFEADFWMFGSI